MKMQALYQSTKTDNTYRLLEVGSKEHKCKCDQIPPAYPCENEKLVFIAVEGKKPDKKVVAFCKDLTPARAKNVAFLVVSSSGPEVADTLKDIVKSQGVNPVGDVFDCRVKGGLFGVGKVTDSDLNNVKAWAKKIVDSLTD